MASPWNYQEEKDERNNIRLAQNAREMQREDGKAVSKVNKTGLFLFQEGFEFIDTFLERFDLLFEVIIVVGNHRIHKNRIDKRHSDNSSHQEQEREVNPDKMRNHSGISVIRRNGIWYFIPALNRADLEDRIDRAQRRAEMRRIRLSEKAAIQQTKDHNNHKKTQQDTIRLPHRYFEAGYDLCEIREEAHNTEKTKYA